MMIEALVHHHRTIMIVKVIMYFPPYAGIPPPYADIPACSKFLFFCSFDRIYMHQTSDMGKTPYLPSGGMHMKILRNKNYLKQGKFLP